MEMAYHLHKYLIDKLILLSSVSYSTNLSFNLLIILVFFTENR